jgi:hypothetical protein
MELWDYDLTYGKGGRPLFRQCEAVDLHPVGGGTLGVKGERCGADAMRGVTWEGVEGRHSILVCDRHTLKWAAPSVGEVQP